ncbi:MAG: SIMPL domain-containing protein [Burkholderiaceae bacterium]
MNRLSWRVLARGVAVTSLLSGALLLPGYSLASQQHAQPVPKISVSATGTAELAPDLAIVTMSVRTEEPTARRALTVNNDKMAQVLQALTESGIADTDMQTSGFSINPRIQYPNKREPGAVPKTVGYTVQNTLTVRVKDLSRVGAVLDQSVSLGVNRGGSIRFSNLDPADAIKQARIEAVERARDKAETLAQAAGVELGKILRITEQTRQPRAAPIIQAARSMSAEATAVPIASGENTYSVSVNIDWQIRQ